MHRLLWVDSEKIDSLARDFFIHALIDMGASYILYNEAGEIICITGLPPKWQSKLDSGPEDESIFGTNLAQELVVVRNSLHEPGDQSEIEHESDDGGFYQLQCRKVRMPDKAIYFIVSINDRTEERQREKLLHTLLLEVSHRSKNMLAIVQGLASQTARYSGSLDTFLFKFRGRLQALSKSQDIITDSDWRGASISQLIAAHTERYVKDNPLRISITGDDPFLPPNTAINVGLALHELAANAVAHHDLSNGSGSIAINCISTNAGDMPVVQLSWTEDFDETTSKSVQPAGEGFGKIILEKVVPTAINGIANYVVGKTADYTLTFPREIGS